MLIGHFPAQRMCSWYPFPLFPSTWFSTPHWFTSIQGFRSGVFSTLFVAEDFASLISSDSLGSLPIFPHSLLSIASALHHHQFSGSLITLPIDSFLSLFWPLFCIFCHPDSRFCPFYFLSLIVPYRCSSFHAAEFLRSYSSEFLWPFSFCIRLSHWFKFLLSALFTFPDNFVSVTALSCTHSHRCWAIHLRAFWVLPYSPHVFLIHVPSWHPFFSFAFTFVAL